MSDTTLMQETTAQANEGSAASESAEGVATAATEQGQEQKSVEGQPAAEVKTEAEDKTKSDGKPEGAPEKYEFKPHEGLQFSEHVMGEFSEVAKELNLSQDAAQKVLDKVAPAIRAQQTETLEKAKSEWAAQASADKEFGGEKLAENVAVAEKALATFGSQELRDLLKESGLSHNPEVIRAFYRVGKAISEDGFVTGQASKPNPGDARRLYNTSNMNP